VALNIIKQTSYLSNYHLKNYDAKTKITTLSLLSICYQMTMVDDLCKTRFIVLFNSNTTGVTCGVETRPKHPSVPLVFIGVRFARSLVFSVVFCRSLFVLLAFSFWLLYWLSSIYGFRMSLWYSSFSS
jgi:hypothetical protein